MIDSNQLDILAILNVIYVSSYLIPSASYRSNKVFLLCTPLGPI
jgi:hypothetical protein